MEKRVLIQRSRVGSWIVIAILISLVSASIVVMSPGAKATETGSKVIVSLTWDDGRASQAASTALQDAHGMKATYYINSAGIGSSNYYLSKTELDAIALGGNEIGGHTQRHENLTTIPLDQAAATICQDRQTLVGWYGEQAGRSFAYPFGASNEAVRAIPQTCGYTSARAVTGVRTPTACLGCRLSESLPPLDPWNLAGPTSVTSSTTFEDLKFQIDQAGANGGGWVIYTFHSLGVANDLYSVDPALYDSFLSWLQNQPTVEVRTVGDVMATTWPTPTTTTTTPAPPPPPPTSVPLVNADLEIDANANGVSDCWLRGSSGLNTATWRRTTDAHSGNAAEEVTISQFTRGDRKLVHLLDNGTANGGCAPSVSDTSTYSLGVWYRSSGKSNFVIFTRNVTGTWSYWKTGPDVAASSTWRNATFSPGKLPAGTTAISFGLALGAIGTLTADDYSLSQDDQIEPPKTDLLVSNSSFETDSNSDGMADCWIRGGYGTSTATFQRVAEARSGAWAQRLTVSSYASGDRKIVQALDNGQAAGGCATNISPGTQYWLRTWYQSTVSPLVFVYVRDSAGVWRWWLSTMPYAASQNWTEASFLTPPIPAGTTAISFGLGLLGNGTLTVDDASASPL